MIYFDNAATTPVTKDVLNAMLPYFTEQFGNPSSLHQMGTMAKVAVTKAREQVARAINAEPEQIFFTSGATESNNWVISGFEYVMCSPYEHHSVSKRPNVSELGSYMSLEENLYEWSPDLVSHMYVNNETGEIYDVKSMAAVCKHNVVPFHTDATQAFGHVPVDVKQIGCDFLSLSGHKFHAPKGIGVLYIKEPDDFYSMLYGGGQQNGLRSGTEPVPLIVGMGTAAELYNYNPDIERCVKTMRDKLKSYILAEYPVIINEAKHHTNNILSVAFKDIQAENLIYLLNIKGLCVSGGSACNSQLDTVSESIRALQLPVDYVHGVIRFSFSHLNTIEEVKSAEQILHEAMAQLNALK